MIPAAKPEHAPSLTSSGLAAMNLPPDCIAANPSLKWFGSPTLSRAIVVAAFGGTKPEATTTVSHILDAALMTLIGSRGGVLRGVLVRSV